MEFWDNLKSDMAEVADSLNRKAQDSTTSMKLNNQNRIKQKEIEKLLYELGANVFRDDPGYCKSNYRDLVMQIHAAQDTIKTNQRTLEKISASPKCPHCGADLTPDARFCIYCGKKIE